MTRWFLEFLCYLVCRTDSQKMERMERKRVKELFFILLSSWSSPVEKEMAPHSSILRESWTEEPGGLPSRGSHRVGHDWSDLACMHALERETAPHSSVLAWRIPGTEEPGGLQSMGSQRVRHDWATSLSLFTFMHWRRKWQPTPVFLPGESQGWRSLVGCHLWGHTESDTTKAT